jgi:hypothetical protein
MKQRETEENRGNNEKKWRERERGKDVFYSYLTSPLRQTNNNDHYPFSMFPC